MKILDIGCRAGGATKGLEMAGHTVEGVDIEFFEEYPGKMHVKDLRQLDTKWVKENFEALWISVPCQPFLWSTSMERRLETPDLTKEARALALVTGLPYVMENVLGAPIREDLVLCGQMFGIRILRHRKFEIQGFHVPQPKHVKHRKKVDETHSYYACVSGHGGDSYSFTMSDWQKAIGIDWITNKHDLAQAVPPLYAEYIGHFLKPKALPERIEQEKQCQLKSSRRNLSKYQN